MLQISTFSRIIIFSVVALGLLLAMPNGFYSRVEMYNDANKLVEAGEPLSAEMQAARSGWVDWLPSGLVNLGLDLRGGAHLLAEVQVEDVYVERMDSYWVPMRDALRVERDVIGGIRRVEGPADELRIRVGNPDAVTQALELVRAQARPVVSLSGIGSTDIEARAEGDTIIISLTEDEKIATNDRTMQQSLEIIRRRVDEAGTREPTIQRQGERRILIQVPGVGSAQELKDLIGKTARLTFHPVIRPTTNENERPGPLELIYPSIDPGDGGAFYILEKAPVITGDDLVDARPDTDQNGLPVVVFRLAPSGGAVFCRYSGENVGRAFAITLDEEVVSAPVIREAICGGSGQISGNFNVQETTNLAILLRAGALPAEMEFLEERTVGPELGQDSIDAGKIACIVAFLAVLVFMALSYGMFGIFANIALLVNVGMIFGILSAIGATLTLPGIAGIVLTIGMAVDANVLVFERIREELRTAKGPARAIELGYEKALSAIIDANITTLIVAVILFIMGSGPVRGFSVTLFFGILTSVFTAIFVTRLLLVIWFERKRPKTIEV